MSNDSGGRHIFCLVRGCDCTCITCTKAAKKLDRMTFEQYAEWVVKEMKARYGKVKVADERLIRR